MKLISASLLLMGCGLIEANSQPRRLFGRHEALAQYKRQDQFCMPGYYQCPIEFGGGCCMNGRFCATSSCPVLMVNPPYVPNAVSTPSGVTIPVPASTNAPIPSNTPSSTPSNIQTTSTAEKVASSTPASTPSSTPPPSQSSSPPPSNTTPSSTTSSLTPAQASAAAASASIIAAGYKYARGITTGAKVGIAFAGITGFVLVGLILWRAITGIRHPKPKRGGKRPMPPPPPPAGSGPASAPAAPSSGPRAGAASGPTKRFKLPSVSLPSVSLPSVSLPFTKKKKYMAMGDDHQPMTRDGSAGEPHAGMSMASGSTPMFQQDTGYMSTTSLAGGGDLGHRMADTFDDGRSHETQGFIR